MCQYIRRIMDKLCSAGLKSFIILQQPPGKQCRKHAFCLRVAGFFAPDIQIPAVDQHFILLGSWIQIINIWCDGIALFIHTCDSADDTIPHNRLDLFRIQAFLTHLPTAFSHAVYRQRQIFIHIHIHPSRMRVSQCCRCWCRCHAFHFLIIYGYFYTLCSRIKSKIKLFHFHTSDTFLQVSHLRLCTAFFSWRLHFIKSHIRKFRRTILSEFSFSYFIKKKPWILTQRIQGIHTKVNIQIKCKSSSLSSRLYCRLRNLTGSCIRKIIMPFFFARGLYRR